MFISLLKPKSIKCKVRFTTFVTIFAKLTYFIANLQLIGLSEMLTVKSGKTLKKNALGILSGQACCPNLNFEEGSEHLESGVPAITFCKKSK